MRTLPLLVTLCSLAGCAPAHDRAAELAAWKRILDPRIGLTEPELVRAMRRMPDAQYQSDASTRMLRWTYDTSYTQPGTSPDYIAVGTSIVPVGGTPPQRVQVSCNVEWLLVDGKSTAYTLRGSGCP